MSHRGQHASSAGTSTAEARDWRGRAACRGEDPELWFPVGEPGSPNYDSAAEIAKAICADCPVVVECLEDALQAQDKWAIRGGLDPTERGQQFGLRWRRKRPAYPCAVCGAGMGAPKRKSGTAPRYCSDECRTESKRRRQAEYDQRQREAVA